MDDIQTPIISAPNLSNLAPIKRGGFVIKIVVGLIILAVLGTGVSLATRAWDPVWNPFRPNPEKVMEEMYSNMKKVKTFHTEAKISFEGEGKSQEIKDIRGGGAYFDFSGDIDKTDVQNLKSSGVSEVKIESDGTQFSLGLEFKAVGNEYYFKLTKIPLLSFLPIDLSGIKNQWIRIEANSEEFPQEISEQQKQIIEEIKNIIKGKNFYSVKKELPEEKIDSKDTYHFLLALNNEELKNAIFEIEDRMEKLGYSTSSGETIAKEARIKSDMLQLRTVAEIIYDWKSGYSNFNCNNSKVKPICESISEEAGAKPVIFAFQNDYCAFVTLPVQGYYYCVDSSSSPKVVTNPNRTGYCDGRTFICPSGTEVPEEMREKIAKEEFLKVVEKFFGNLGEVTAEIWIGKKDKLLYKLKYEKDFNLANIQEGAEGNLNTTAEIFLSGFDKSIEIEAPKDSKKLEEILGPFFIPSQDLLMFLPAPEGPLEPQDFSVFEASVLDIISKFLKR